MLSAQLDDLHLPLAKPARSILGNDDGIAKLRRASVLQSESWLYVEHHARLEHDLSHCASRTASRQSAKPARMDHQRSRFITSRDEPLVVRCEIGRASCRESEEKRGDGG